METPFLPITPFLQLLLSEVEFTYARSSGPGGQNVNKVNSKAVLRWKPGASRSFPEPIRARILLQISGQLTEDGDLVLSSDRFRDQIRNREDCLEKLRKILRSAVTPPTPRKKTRPTKASKRRKRDFKSRQSEKKGLRKSVRSHD